MALSEPAMLEPVEPVTRFSTAAPAPGWTKLTALPRPIEKLFQSMTARLLV